MVWTYNLGAVSFWMYQGIVKNKISKWLLSMCMKPRKLISVGSGVMILFSPNINNNVNTNLKSRLRIYPWDVVAVAMGAWVQQGKYQFVDENTDNET